MNEQTTAKKVPTIATDIVDGALVLTFSHGQTLTLTLSTLSEDIAKQAMIHGLKQKLVDAAAISCDPETGRAATVETKYNAVKEVFDRLVAGEWNKKREAGTQSGGMLFRALVKMFDGRKSETEVKAWLETKTEAEKVALRKNEKVAAIIETMRTPSAGGVDTDALLGELDTPVDGNAKKSGKKS